MLLTKQEKKKKEISAACVNIKTMSFETSETFFTMVRSHGAFITRGSLLLPHNISFEIYKTTLNIRTSRVVSSCRLHSVVWLNAWIVSYMCNVNYLGTMRAKQGETETRGCNYLPSLRQWSLVCWVTAVLLAVQCFLSAVCLHVNVVGRESHSRRSVSTESKSTFLCSKH